jgi:hypothetical protein
MMIAKIEGKRKLIVYYYYQVAIISEEKDNRWCTEDIEDIRH